MKKFDKTFRIFIENVDEEDVTEIREFLKAWKSTAKTYKIHIEEPEY